MVVANQKDGFVYCKWEYKHDLAEKPGDSPAFRSILLHLGILLFGKISRTVWLEAQGKEGQNAASIGMSSFLYGARNMGRMKWLSGPC